MMSPEADKSEAPSGVIKPGTLIGEHYQVVKLLGEGGMGSVFLVQDTTLSRYLALKVLQPEMSERIESDAHFRQEARMLSCLSHPNIVTIHAFGTTPGGMNYITMEYVEGQTIDAQSFTTEALVSVIQQVCNGLAEAHSRGIVHRDIKPANILLTSVAGVSHFAKVVDFGLAQIREEKGDGTRPITLTEGNKVVGTPAYMSPEQAMGKRVDPRSDVYALGVLVCELLTGSLPFEADTHFQMLTAHVNTPPRLPSELRPDLGFEGGGPMDAFITRALQKHPDARFQSVGDFAISFADAAARWSGHELSDAHRTLSPASRGQTPLSASDDTEMHLEAVDPGEERVAAPQVAALVMELDEVFQADYDAPAGEVADCLEVLASKVEQAVLGAGGRLVHGMSDRQVALFRSQHGLQLSIEGAVQAGLAIQSAVDALSLDPTIPPAFRPEARMAIDAGEIISAKAGGGELIFGPVLLGSRALARATPCGGLSITQRAYRRVRGSLETEALSDTKGQAGRLVSAKRQVTRMGGSEIHGVPLELIGRDAELEQLSGLATAPLAGQGLKTLLVVGPAGIGKTRIVSEQLERLEAQSPSPWVEFGHCTAGGMRVAYEPLLDALRRRIKVTEDDSDSLVRVKAEAFVRRELADDPTQLTREEATLVSFIAGLLGREADDLDDVTMVHVQGEGAQRALLFERFATLYKRMARRRPLILFFDDLQWASGLTRELLGYLLGQLVDEPLLVIGTSSPEAQSGVSAALQREHIALETLALEPLDEAASEALVRHALRRLVEVPPQMIRGIVRLAEGVPLIVEETIHDLIDEGGIEVEGARWRLATPLEGQFALPKTVEQLFTGRYERLPAGLRRALECAACAGERFWPDQVHSLAEGELPEDALSELATRGFLRPRREVIIDNEPDYTFVQGAMREAVYAGIHKERREAMHLAVAEWLEPHVRTGGTQFDGIIGHHFLTAGEGVRALAYLKRAARHELALYDLEAAISTFKACLLTLTLIPRAEMSPQRRSELTLEFTAELVRLRVLTGSLQQAIEDSDDASLGAAVEGRSARHSQAKVFMWRGWALMRLGRYQDAQEAFSAVGGMLEGSGDASLTLQAATGLASTKDKLGDALGASTFITEAIAAYEASSAQLGDDAVHLSAAYRALGNSRILQKAFDEAREAFDRAYVLAEEGNAPETLVDVLNGQATVHYYLGEVPAAEATFKKALQIADQWDLIEHRAVLLNNLGELAWSRKDSAEALDLLERAEALSRFVGMEVGLADGCRIQAEIQLSLGQLHLAEEQALIAIAAAERMAAPRYIASAQRTLADVLERHRDIGGDKALLTPRIRAAYVAASAAYEAAKMPQEASACRELIAAL